MLYSVFLFRQGRPEESLNAARAAAVAFPKALQPRLGAGRALFHLGRLEEAAAELRHAVQIDPGSRAAHLTLSRVYASLGRESESDEHARIGASLNEKR